MLESATRTSGIAAGGGAGAAAANTAGAGDGDPTGADTIGVDTTAVGATSRADGVEGTSATADAGALLGGAQPGGGTKALLGSAARTGAETATSGVGAAAAATGSAATLTTGAGAGVGIDAVAAATGAAVWPGGVQSAGGTKALLGSPRRAGDGAATTASVGTRSAG